MTEDELKNNFGGNRTGQVVKTSVKREKIAASKAHRKNQKLFQEQKPFYLLELLVLAGTTLSESGHRAALQTEAELHRRKRNSLN